MWLRPRSVVGQNIAGTLVLVIQPLRLGDKWPRFWAIRPADGGRFLVSVCTAVRREQW